MGSVWVASAAMEIVWACFLIKRYSKGHWLSKEAVAMVKVKNFQLWTTYVSKTL